MDVGTESKLYIGKYEVVSFLGRGGMAETYRCRHHGIGGFEKHVVVKRIRPEFAQETLYVQMFLDEARLHGVLNHSNIAQVFEIDEADGIPFMAMEYVDGPTLTEVYRKASAQKRIHFGHLARVVSGIAMGLDYVHNASSMDGKPLGLVHRDVSPGNIMVNMDGVPKLLDFGVAKAVDRMVDETQGGGLKGKVRYMAPEQIARGETSPLSDVYSLGVTLFVVTTGKLPYVGATDAELMTEIVDGRAVSPSELDPDYPRDLERIVKWAIHTNPAKRLPNGRMFHSVLDKFIAEGGGYSTEQEYLDWLAALFPTADSYGVESPPLSLMSEGGSSGTGSAKDVRAAVV
ncbi:MAG: serine/threonine protein kinase, partial [Acidimicrobiia bacterium]|nr:serine/threonine protein kinase [Acidimicrobiia bacterium]